MTPLIQAELGAGVVAWTLFILIFAMPPRQPGSEPWWRSPWGQMVMYAHVATDLLLIWSLIGALFPRHAHRLFVFTLLLALLDLAGIWQLIALIRSQRGGDQ